MVYYSKNEKDTMLLGEKFGKAAQRGDVFCLNGELGAGKTVFSRGFAAGLGIDKQITSPTFTLLNEYEGRLPLFHFDAYRLESSSGSQCFDFCEYFDYGVCIIEWAENVLDVIPENSVFINIERVDGYEDERKISVDRKGNNIQ